MHNIYRDLNVGIPENEHAGGVKVYPVPANDRLKIQLEDGIVVESLGFYAITGQQVTVPLFNANEYDISALTPGVYFVKVKTSSSAYWAKVLKE